MPTDKTSIFSKPKNKRLAKIIKLDTPMNARQSVQKLEENGVTTEELRAANLAANRADAQLKRRNLSLKERREFTQVRNIYRRFVNQNKKEDNGFMNTMSRFLRK